MDYMDIKSAAKLWDLAERRLTMLCRNRRIEGAKKEGGIWLIPVSTPKPPDGRSNKSTSVMAKIRRLPLPIGMSDYKKLVEKYYYVDKTLFIRDFLDERPLVSLFTRPRRFGKTLTMDMLKTFFELSDTDTSDYFRDKKIWSCGDEYRCEQGQYPVIFLTFKDVKCATWEETLKKLRRLISLEYQRHSKLLNGSKLTDYEKEQFAAFINDKVDAVDVEMSLQLLSLFLQKHYGKSVIIIIDEYDTPIQHGYTAGYYDEVVGFMRNLFSGAFKDNPNLAYGFLTGILRVAKESIFSGLNNLAIHSILDEKYSKYFGFTVDEIKEMANYYGVAEKFDEICEWYNGYRFGGNDIFNPWSVINYFYNNCFPKAYWQSTGDNSIIRQIVSEADDEIADNLRCLMQGQVVFSYVDASVIYPEIKRNPSTVYSFLLAAGYLKTVKKDDLHDGNFICDIAIPNKEIFYVYEREILSALSNVISQSTAIAIQQALITQDIPKLETHLQKLLLDTISSFDYAHENFYHGLILGICAIMNNRYRVDSNRESGYGRYDIRLMPRKKSLPGIVIELKVLKKDIAKGQVETELEKSADTALRQIDEKQYVATMKQDGIEHFLKIGIAFYKKQVRLLSRSE